MEIVYFITILLLGLVIALTFSAIKLGSVTKLITYLKSSEGSGIFTTMLLGVGIIVMLTLFLYVAVATADWFKWTETYIGFDYSLHTNNSICTKDNLINDRFISNLGVRQAIYSMDNMEVISAFTHHSCFVGKDNLTYDALGLQVKYRIDWK